MTLLEKLKLLRSVKGVGFYTIVAGNEGLTFNSEGQSIYINWDELIYELKTLELYRTYATVKGLEDEDSSR